MRGGKRRCRIRRGDREEGRKRGMKIAQGDANRGKEREVEK
jgi:hypothetical protein